MPSVVSSRLLVLLNCTLSHLHDDSIEQTVITYYEKLGSAVRNRNGRSVALK